MSAQISTVVVKELCCSSEEALIRKKLSALEGVEIRGINILEKTVSLNHSCSGTEILDTLRTAGMQAHFLDTHEETPPFLKRHEGAILLISSALLLLAGLWRSLSVENDIFSFILFSASILGSGKNVLFKGWKSLKAFSLDMNVLMSVAAIGAMAIGKWSEGAVVMFLFALSELLEHYSVQRSRKAIRNLMSTSPSTVTLITNGNLRHVDVKSVSPGERIIIRPGEQIPLDGIVRSGESALNQSLITGESKPVTKQSGDTVFAGSFNGQGTLELEITTRHSDTMLARIIRLVESAQLSRAPIHGIVDQFARYYTPAVFALACAIAIIPPLIFSEQTFFDWFYRALVLLVIACPCALVLSTPVTIMSGLANAAKRGVLIKGGKYLELLGTVKAIAFDKTGTLTKGKPHVTDIISFGSLNTNDLLRIASTLESRSEHHLAKAIKQKAISEHITFDDTLLKNFESLTGKGVRAELSGQTYFAGSHALIEEMKICTPEVERQLELLERNGKTTIILSTQTEPLGIIAVADEIRAETSSIIRTLRESGVKKIIMLTGDNKTTAATIGNQAGIDEVHAEILPHEKVAHVRALQSNYGAIAMVGDGMNDAPALASATIGIAMGKTGTDVTLEAADVVLISDELEKIVHSVRLSKATLRIIKQNIAIALITKTVFLLLGTFGIATLWMAIIADDGATLAVILNGLRILRYK